MSRRCLALLSGHSSPGPTGLQPDYTRARGPAAPVRSGRGMIAPVFHTCTGNPMTPYKILAAALIALAGSTPAAFADSYGQDRHEAEKQHQEMHRERHKHAGEHWREDQH